MSALPDVKYPLHLSRDQVRGQLKIPAPHFLARGFTPEVLEDFDIGDSTKLWQVVIPLYDDDGEFCKGYTVRSYKPRCDACRKYHDPGGQCRFGQQKWGIERGFPKRHYLYNFGAALRSNDPFVFLVEGPPDVWRLTEAGYTGIALLGADATGEQMEKLATLGKRVRVALDNDRAGVAARERFWANMEAMGHPFAAEDFFVPAPYNDFGDVPADELRRFIDGSASRVA